MIHLGRLSDVETDVEAVRVVHLSHRCHEILRGLHHFGQRLRIDVKQFTAMMDRRHHRVAGRIRVEVEKGERPGIPAKGQRRTIVLRCKRIAEDALTAITIVNRRHVLEPPWGEKGFDHRRSLLQQFFPEMLTGFEVWNFLRWHVDLFARLRVPPGAFAALTNPKGPEATKLDFLVAAKGRDDALENYLNHLVRLFPRDIGRVGHRLHKISFGHCHVAVLLAPPQSTRLPSVFLLLVISRGLGRFIGFLHGLPRFALAAVHFRLCLDGLGILISRRSCLGGDLALSGLVSGGILLGLCLGFYLGLFAGCLRDRFSLFLFFRDRFRPGLRW